MLGFPGGSEGKAPACNAGDPGSIPGSGRSPGGGNGNPLQYSCLEISWAEKPGGLQSMGSQSQTGLSEFTSLHFISLKLLCNQKCYFYANLVLPLKTPPINSEIDYL